MTRELTLTFPAPADPLSMNEGDGRAQGRAKQAWRDAAYFRWCEAHPGVGPEGRAFPPAEVFTLLTFPVRRTRDPVNFARTVKAIVDGIRMAGAWPDDTDEYVTQHLPRLSVEASGLCVVRMVAR